MIPNGNGIHNPASTLAGNIPAPLRDCGRRWITWAIATNRRGDLTKLPSGSTLTPGDWRSFDEVAPTLGQPDRGVGLVLTDRLRIGDYFLVALDVDACRDPANGALSAWVYRALTCLPPTYVEVSPSGFGLRMFLLVRDLPPAIRTIMLRDAPTPPGCTKKTGANIQVFGCGAAGFVTVTGDHVSQYPRTLGRCDSLDPLLAEFDATTTMLAEDVAMPSAAGDVPTIDELAARVQKSPAGPALLRGGFAELDLPSASEVYWRLIQTVLPAASNDGELAVRFLMERTAFGSGRVDSREPARYMDERWVRAEVLRIAGKRRVLPTAQAFAAFDCEAWRPPADADTGWLLPVSAFVESGRRERFLVKGVLPATGLAQMFGPFSCGKTPFALSLALHVSMGIPEWFGYPIKAAGPVIYLIGEDATGIRDRIIAQTKALDPLVDYSDIPLFVSRHPARLTQRANRRRWVREIRAILDEHGLVEREPALVIIDTQSANMGPGDENSTETMLQFVYEVNALARQLNCLVLLVHHSGITDSKRGRGSGTVANAADAQFRVARSGTTVTVVPTKAKNWRDPAPLIGYLEPVAIGVDSDGDPITAVTVTDTAPDPAEVFSGDDNVQALLDCIGVLPLTATGRKLAELTGLSRSSLRRAVDRAEALGMLTVDRGRGGAPSTYTRSDLADNSLGHPGYSDTPSD